MLQLKSALALILAQRVWQGMAGIVTILVVINVLSIEEQGLYYSFLSFAALSTLFDLGLSLALMQVASHSSASLVRSLNGYNQATGQLAELIAFGARYYAVLALLFVVLVLPAGWIFFSVFARQFAGWQPAWITVSVTVALSLVVIPILAIYEGSGEITAVAGIRLSQAIIGSVATWTMLLGGGQVWATAMAPLAALISATIWIRRRHPEVLSIIKTNSQTINWNAELWPLQWRIGLSWVSGYMLTQIHTLVLFSMQSTSAAGQLGLSMAIGNMIGLFAQSFIARHVPAMARAVARRQWEQFDTMFRRDFTYSCVLFVASSVVAIGLAAILRTTPYGTRILPILPFAGLLLAIFLIHVNGALAAQLRSYRREPLAWVVTAGALMTLMLVWPSAYLEGAAGIVAVMLTVQLIFVLPLSLLLYYRRNREWRMA